MAVDALLKIEGKDIKGESKIDGHEDEIDIYSWTWGMTQSGTFHTGKGGGAGKVNVQDLTVTKYVDSSTPDFMMHCCNGAHIPSATLTIRKSGEQPIDYVVIELTKVMVTSVQPAGAPGDELVMEQVTFNFAEFKITYTAQEDDGAAGAQFDCAWNIESNRAG
ncbi:MAG: type VI secretion system tube protein Hcp [Pseudomonadota bacterium]